MNGMHVPDFLRGRLVWHLSERRFSDLIQPWKTPILSEEMQRQPGGFKQVYARNPEMAPVPAGGVQL